MSIKPEGFKKEICGECGQAKTYLLALDRGTTVIVSAFAAAVRKKGINIIHPKKEMEVHGKEWNLKLANSEGVLTSTQIGNLTRARVHGLLARVKNEAGNWCMTTKGAQFLKNIPVPRFAIMRKSTAEHRSHKDEYFEPEHYTITASELALEGENWAAIDFQIVDGRIVYDLPPPKAETKQSTLPC